VIGVSDAHAPRVLPWSEGVRMADCPMGWSAIDSTGLSLTTRECEIMSASARGAGVSAVALELGIPVVEVREGLASTMAKLGARSKLEAIIIALRTGLIAP
jgi:DNA-binding NarL/FixJ family response regulator